MSEKSPQAFRTISEVAEDLDLPQHVLRFWETRFSQIRPMKRGGGRRYYRPEDVDLLRGIRHLLYSDGYTIKGVQRILKEQGVRQVAASWREAQGEEGSASSAGVHRTAESAEAEPPEASAWTDEAGVDEPQRESVEAAPAEDFGGGTQQLPAEAVRKLQATLFELMECKRILQEARQDS